MMARFLRTTHRLQTVRTRPIAISTATGEIDARLTGMGSLARLRSEISGAETPNRHASRTEKVRVHEIRRRATTSLGKAVTGSRRVTKDRVRRIAIMTTTAVGGVGGGGAAVIARTVAAVALEAEAWSASRAIRSSLTMTCWCPRAASWTCSTTTPLSARRVICRDRT